MKELSKSSCFDHCERLELLVGHLSEWLRDARTLDGAMNEAGQFEPVEAKKVYDSISRHWKESLESAGRVMQEYAILNPFGQPGQGDASALSEFRKLILHQLQCRVDVLGYLTDAQEHGDGTYADIDDSVEDIGMQISSLSEVLGTLDIEEDSSPLDTVDQTSSGDVSLVACGSTSSSTGL